MSGSAKDGRNHRREAHVCELRILNMLVLARSSVARARRSVFSLDNDLHGSRQTIQVMPSLPDVSNYWKLGDY